ncbi:MAG TPA: FAD-dependent oxidoreductase [Stellaceae bacterium]|nr:FAD-dependent oxidoreductase [Stellaceae bacterium]
MAADFLIIGGGMAGAAAGYFLAAHGSVTLLEREETLAYHSTGRSAALYTETYGNSAIRALTVRSGDFFRDPPAGFTETPLLTPRGVLYVARAQEKARFEEALAIGRRFAPSVRALAREEALALCPVLRDDWLAHAFLEPDAMDLDVNAIHQGFLRGLRARGGQVVTGAAAQAIARRDGAWEVKTPRGRFAAPNLVDAAGAWADEVAALAGVAPVGLVPKRRTVIIVETEPPAHEAVHWPMVGDVGEGFYFRPESGRLLVSPADETPVAPCDVQPEEMDMALAASRFEDATRLKVRRIARKWAGLRTFAPDKTLVVGPDPTAPGFFWMAGQGGYGIQTAPAAGRALATLATAGTLEPELAARGLAPDQLLPTRLRS